MEASYCIKYGLVYAHGIVTQRDTRIHFFEAIQLYAFSIIRPEMNEQEKLDEANHQNLETVSKIQDCKLIATKLFQTELR